MWTTESGWHFRASSPTDTIERYMLFALWDYLNYRRRSGRYAKELRGDHGDYMAGAWDNTLPPHVISMLEDFVLLAFETFEDFSSWAIMYGTSSLVSHVAMFAKPANV